MGAEWGIMVRYNIFPGTTTTTAASGKYSVVFCYTATVMKSDFT
jgi:hypothetical protein